MATRIPALIQLSDPRVAAQLVIYYKDRSDNVWVRERTQVIHIISNVRKMKWSWAGHINRLKDDDGPHVSRLGDHIIWQEKTTKETSKVVKRRPGQILERRVLAEDSTREGNQPRDTTAAQWWWWLPKCRHRFLVHLFTVGKNTHLFFSIADL